MDSEPKEKRTVHAEFMARKLKVLVERAKAMESDPDVIAHRAEMAREAAERAKAEVEFQAEQQRRALAEELPKRGLGVRIIDHLAGELQATPALERVRAFVEPSDPYTFLFLAGGVGVGKTLAGGWAVKREAGSLMVKAIEVARYGLYATEKWELVYAAKVLVIDDLGREPLDPSGWTLANLMGLFDRRYEDRAKTILTGNLTKAAVLARYTKGPADPLYDRLRESAEFFECPGGSLRQAPSGEGA